MFANGYVGTASCGFVLQHFREWNFTHGAPALADKQGRNEPRIIGPPTARPRIIGPCVRTLDLPLLVRLGVFFFFFCFGGADFWCFFFRPFPEEEISDYIVHGPIIGVLTVDSQSLATLCYIG